MKLFLAYLRLLRPFNLIMIAFTMDMVRFFLFGPLNWWTNFHFVISENTFMLFTLAFVLVAAAGYIINDYYDVEIDIINKPIKVVIGNLIHRKLALIGSIVLSICGIIAGFWSSINAGVPLLGLLFIFYALGLWLYSYKLKSTFLIGNLLIAIFLGLVPLAAAYIELQADLKSPDFINSTIGIIPYRIGAWTISGFAFLSTLIREIVKDMEDMEGDRIADCHTMPIVLGIKKVRIVVLLLLLIMLGLLSIFQQHNWEQGWHISFYYVLIAIQLPCLIVAWLIIKSTQQKEFHRISIWLKIVMLTGICYLFVFAYEAYSAQQHIIDYIHPTS